MGNDLMHYGIPGMKWGQRRYQNKDGSLTPAGKKRYGDGTSSLVSTQKRKLPPGTITELPNHTRKLPIGTKTLVSTQEHKLPGPVMKDGYQEHKLPGPVMKDGYQEHKLPGHVARVNSKKKQRVDKMSDEELRSQLNRLRMEDEYKRLTKKEVGKGKKAVDKLIKAGTTVATATTTAIIIRNNLQKLGMIK